MSEELRERVRKYVELYDEVAELAKSVREMKKRRDEMGAAILDVMKDNDVDEVQLEDGGKLVRRASRRTEALKKEHVASQLRGVLQPSDVDGVVETMYGNRATTSKDTLSRRKT